jgi:hypothetical protein
MNFRRPRCSSRPKLPSPGEHPKAKVTRNQNPKPHDVRTSVVLMQPSHKFKHQDIVETHNTPDIIMNSCPLDSFMSQFIGSTTRGGDPSNVTIVCDNAKVTSLRKVNNVGYPLGAFVSKGSSNTSSNAGCGRVHFNILCDEAIEVCESTTRTRTYSKNTTSRPSCRWGENTVVHVSNDGPKPKIRRHSSGPMPRSRRSSIPSLPPVRRAPKGQRAAMFDDCSSSLDKAPRSVQRSQSPFPLQSRRVSC